jgi:hypothetical protein
MALGRSVSFATAVALLLAGCAASHDSYYHGSSAFTWGFTAESTSFGRTVYVGQARSFCESQASTTRGSNGMTMVSQCRRVALGDGSDYWLFRLPPYLGVNAYVAGAATREGCNMLRNTMKSSPHSANPAFTAPTGSVGAGQWFSECEIAGVKFLD